MFRFGFRSDLESDNSELNIETDIAQRTDMAEARAVSPAYPYGNQAMFRAEHAEVEPNQLLTVKLKGNDRTFVMPEEAIGSEIGVCGCHGPLRLVDLFFSQTGIPCRRPLL